MVKLVFILTLIFATHTFYAGLASDQNVNKVEVESNTQVKASNETLTKIPCCEPLLNNIEYQPAPIKQINPPVVRVTNDPTKMTLQQAHNECQIPIDEDALTRVNDVLFLLQNDPQARFYKKQFTLNKYLTIKVLSPAMPTGFWSDYKQKISKIMTIYQDVFGFYLLEKQEINLIIIPSREQYADTLETLSIDGKYSQGLFWSATNMAFVEYKNDNQVMKTALHESVHTLNLFFAGFIARWLNEGLAEYFEKIMLTEKSYSFNLQLDTIHQPAKEIGDLLTANQLWNISDAERRSLYNSAFLLTSYFYQYRMVETGNTQPVNILQKLLKKESEDVCTTLTDNDYQAIIDEDYIYLPQSFSDWDHQRREQP